MNKPVFVDQPGWLGDIIFVMAIAQKYERMGHQIIYPVPDEYLKTPSIQKNFPTIEFVNRDEFPNYKKYYGGTITEDDDYIFLPFIGNYNKNPCYDHMRYKYELLGFPMDMWRDVEITRDYENENKLINVLGIEEGEKFNLINENHKYMFIKTSINVKSEYRNIYMNKINGYNLFDWIGVMEKAQSIHTVGTSIVFLMDAINTMPNDMHFYPRNDNKPHSTYDFLLKKNFIYH